MEQETNVKEEKVEQQEEQLSEQQPESQIAAEMPTEETPDIEAQIAAEALEDDTGEDAKSTTAPVSVVAELRAERRANRQLIETLQQQIAERSRPPEQPPELSPIEKYYKDNPELDPNLDAPPGSVLMADRRWQRQQQEKDEAAQQVQARRELGETSTADARAKLEDFDEVVTMGSKYLTNGNKLDIATSKDPAMELYKKCIEATLKSKTADASTMRQTMKAKLTKTPKAGSTETKPKQPEKKVEAEPEKIVEPGMSKELAQIYSTFGL